MSVEAIDITCSKCSFESSEGVAHGIFKYKTNDGLIYLIRKLAWCDACQTLVPAEVIPNDLKINKLKEQLLQVNQDIEKENSRIKGRSIVKKLLFKHDSETLQDLSITKDVLQNSINEMENLKQYVDTNRKPRCLECGSQDIIYLPPLPELDPFTEEEENPIPIGMNHPGCGGELLAAYSSIRFYRQFDERVYTTDGIEC